MSARKRRAENPSVYKIREVLSTELMYRDVLYGDFAGAKIGDAAKAGPSEAALGLAEKDN